MTRRVYNPNSKHPARAQQAWQILVGMAMRRESTTYELLSEKMYGKPAAGVLAKILGHVAYFCEDHDFPPLTAVVISKTEGKSGDGIPVDNVDQGREKVYAFDWYNIPPPTEDELSTSWSAHT